MNARTALLIALLASFAFTAAPVSALDTGGKAPPGLRLAVADAATRGDEAVGVWVRFVDKAVSAQEQRLALDWIRDELPAKVLQRRSRGALGPDLVDEADLPVPAAYLEAVDATGAERRHVSRWLNAVSCRATAAQLEALAALPFVRSLEPLGRGVRNDPVAVDDKALAPPAAGDPDHVDYGASLVQNEMINTLPLHASGLSGRGVTVAVLDTGFDLDRQSFRHVDVVAAWNFVGGNDDVGDDLDESEQQVVHGTLVLSILAGDQPGTLKGTAPGVSVILAKTEDMSDESAVEEDHWVAALEWAEGLGADVVSSSIGYIDWYDFADLDGNTAAITVAAELATARGICVVNSAGNERNNPAWPHIIPPADGRNVIAVGSTDRMGLIGGYSSPGPTADGRIKPDVLGLGDRVRGAHAFIDDLVTVGSGSDYAVPAVAGVVAMMLEANPSLRPGQILEALRATATRAGSPDNDYGWGLADAVGALAYWNPVISHSPLADAEGGTGADYPVEARITGPNPMADGGVRLAWRHAGEHWRILPMSGTGDDYAASIPPQALGAAIEYYIVATDSEGATTHCPADAPAAYHCFDVGPDLTPPSILHFALGDQLPERWPPVVTARADDAFGIASVELVTFTSGGSQTTAEMTGVDGTYAIDFPLGIDDVPLGTRVSYLIRVTDGSSDALTTLDGPHEFEMVASRGRVLLVDDRVMTVAAVSPRPGAVPPAADRKSIDDVAAWITAAGFTVDRIEADDLAVNGFIGYDVVVVSSGQNYNPVAQENLKLEMLAWAREGGRIIVEGGEVGYVLGGEGVAAEIRASVLHVRDWFGEDGQTLWTPSDLRDHPFLHRPSPLPSPLILGGSGLGYGECDLMKAAGDGTVILQSGYGSSYGGVVLHDPNACTDAGQTVYFPFDIVLAGPTHGAALMENALTWLTIEESPGGSAIEGSVVLEGENDHGGVTVRTADGHEAITGAGGGFVLDGLWGGWHTLTASAPGFGPETRHVQLGEDQTADVSFHLVPAVTLGFRTTPGTPIPDNTPDGLTSVLDVSTGARILGVDIDIDIAHYSMGHLVVELTSPEGTTVRLHDRLGGSADDIVGNWPASLRVSGPGQLDDFRDENPQGAWTLTVADLQFGALGTLNAWGLNLLLASDGVTANEDELPPGSLPAVTRIGTNVPNPFNPSTRIDFETAVPGEVRLTIHDARGRTVRRLVDRSLPGGAHTVTWNGRGDSGVPLASGTYFARLETFDDIDIRKMTLVR